MINFLNIYLTDKRRTKMRLTEKFKEFLIYVFLCLVLSFMMFACKPTKGIDSELFSKRRKTEDEKQLEFFKQQIKIKTYYNAKR
jgi:hypothetical protein